MTQRREDRSLREEIANKVLYTCLDSIVGNTVSVRVEHFKCTDEILKLIEQRIDSRIEWFKTEYNGNIDPYITISYFEELKEEMLK